MKTFREFLVILERYYEPNEKLPGSDKTPVEKAVARQNRPLSTDSRGARGRKIRHRLMMHKVRRGANNPSIDDIRHPELIDSYSRTGREYDFYHKPTGISVNVHHSGRTKDGSHKYTISWDHPHPNHQMMSSKTRKVIAKNALNVIRQHILHRLPYGSVAHNTPVPNARRVKGILRLKNTRSRMYQRLGFGPPSEEVSSAGLPDQYAKVGREPSPRQAKKGKTRLSPLHPDKV